MSERQPQGGWERFENLTPDDKLRIYKKRIEKSGFEEAVHSLPLRPLVMFTAMRTLEGANRESYTLGLTERNNDNPSIEEIGGGASILLPWRDKEKKLKTLKMLESNFLIGLTSWEQRSLDEGHAFPEEVLSSANNLPLIEFPIRNDFSNQNYTSESERCLYTPTESDREEAWRTGIEIVKHLGVINEENLPENLLKKVPEVPNEGTDVVLTLPDYPLFAGISVEEQVFDNSSEERIPGQAAVTLYIGHRFYKNG